MFGYVGKVLRVNLSNAKVSHQELDKSLARKYLGGIGFCIRWLYDMTGPETDPLGPENPLIFATGPISGTMWPGSGRLEVAGKSPQTGLIGYSNSGGHFAPYIKYAGYDAIIIEGTSRKPVYLYVEDGRVEIKDASHLWGLDTWETEDSLREELGEDVKVACIGQAGENLVRMASIVTGKYRVAARTGLGAVMGRKRLKAVVLRGNGGVRVARPKLFMELLDKGIDSIERSPFSEHYMEFGTTLLVMPMNKIGRFPTKNHCSGVFPKAEMLSGEYLVEHYRVAKRACFSCWFHCKNVLKLGDEMGDHPEYETICSFGSNLLIDDPEFVIKANWLCDKYGIDTISLGATIAWAMECYEKGLLKKEDVGIELKWGDPCLVERLIQMTAFREGFGDLLAEGVKRASKKIGRGTERYAMEVKGLEIPAQDGRSQKSMGVAHATAARGADHLTHCTFLDEVGFEDAISERFGSGYLPEMADRMSAKYKGIMAKECEDFTAAVNCMVICVSAGFLFPPIFWWEELAQIYSAVTGIDMKVHELKMAAERIVNLRRAYLIRHGISRADDGLPERFTKEPAPEGPCKGQIVEIEQMLDEYYEARGWDKETGWIPEEKLLELGLEEVASQLRDLGRLVR
ncbi:MAG TPA: aldehyde:ferredoxin oxidoreductase [Candidatus Korarchaeota archaeon]|nr:aldehyde:ferredoxin oxidoreductase [Candidatus Korarchaeota archaeon]